MKNSKNQIMDFIQQDFRTKACWFTYEELALNLGLNLTNINKPINELVKKGYLEKLNSRPVKVKFIKEYSENNRAYPDANKKNTGLVGSEIVSDPNANFTPDEIAIASIGKENDFLKNNVTKKNPKKGLKRELKILIECLGFGHKKYLSFPEYKIRNSQELKVRIYEIIELL